ncbi:BA14K family protein [Rhizobium sp. CF142]|uniref:BA14K family protein n=1 Tax=Rhizobium sp. CF142 TaxID=1144314 RepID=UPI00026EEF46|nr:BA14K family protein [Rhizobium sp. CF142]EJJ28432.1 BA14K-like protein [Rhizobium sp. CF142]
MKRLAIIALSLATALTSALPAEAFPTIATPDVEALQAQPVRYRGGYYGGYHGGYYHHHGGGNGWGWALGGLATGVIIGGLLAQPRYYGSGYYDPGYYGSTYDGPYYYGSTRYYARRYYYPRTYYGGNGHVRWCYARYRSYRAYDDTFQPYHGPRQACVSPYY